MFLLYEKSPYLLRKVDKLDFLKFHLHSFPGNVPDAIEQFLKDKTIPQKVLSLSQLHAYII